MTRGNFYKNSKGKYIGFNIEGHSGFAEPGKDIICAAVSTITQSTMHGIKLTKAKVLDREVKADKAQIKMIVSEKDGVDLLIQVMKATIESLAEQYPDHVTLLKDKIMEVEKK